MKKILSFLFPVVALLCLASCSDDDDLPHVDFNIAFENAVQVDGKIYVAVGQDLNVSSITVINKEQGKGALITGANYIWDGYYVGSSITPPYAYSMYISESVSTGLHTLSVECPVYADDKSPATAVVSMPVEVVATPEDLPSDGEATFVVHPSTSERNK